MPKATITVRELRNKDTGIDLSVTGYRELPGLVRSTFEYQIVVVSSLSCFKLPSHKDTDVVQFTLFKRFSEFEDLRVKLHEAFSETALPPIIKKSIIVNEAVIKERRSNLDAFLKFLSSTPGIVTSSHVLFFLGVDAQKAKRFASGEADDRLTKEKDLKSNEDDTEDIDDQNPEEKSASSLFEDEEEVGEDILTAGAQETDDDFFLTPDLHTTPARSARLFESQDLQRELTEEDEKDFDFIPDGIITKKEVVEVAVDDDNEELLNVEDDIDLDRLLTLDTEKRKEEKQLPVKFQAPQRPSIPPKPKPALDKSNPKPSIPSKPKPGTVSSSEKTKLNLLHESTTASQTTKTLTADSEKGAFTGQSVVTKADLSSDEIMKYIAANITEEEADLDLFS